MHELSLAQSILTIAENALPENSKAEITGVGIQVGELSSIEIESLKFAFSVIKAGTRLQNAELDIELIEGEAECSQCHNIFPLHSFGTCCPQCQDYSVKIRKGREMRVLNIMVDDE